ncbi:MAG: hypothetical protein JWQ94_79 [Tardiphaga sp.]|nr:hypothetical protein [Tardiphaga sp.]
MVAPVPTAMDESTDRMVIRLDPGGPIDLAGLGASFAALARIYARHHGETSDEDTAPRLFISKLENGSVIAEIVPYIVILGQAVQFADSAMVVSDFTKRIGKAIKAFSGETPAVDLSSLPSKEDSRDLREFMRPLTGRKGAELNIAHARFEQSDGDKHTLVEYAFTEDALNRAALTIDAELSAIDGILVDVPDDSSTSPLSEVMLFLQQASRAAGKATGRTADRAIVPTVSSKPLPVYFQKGAGDLKGQMIDDNALKATFVVDLEVQKIDGEPRGYIVTNVHRTIFES